MQAPRSTSHLGENRVAKTNKAVSIRKHFTHSSLDICGGIAMQTGGSTEMMKVTPIPMNSIATFGPKGHSLTDGWTTPQKAKAVVMMANHVRSSGGLTKSFGHSRKEWRIT